MKIKEIFFWGIVLGLLAVWVDGNFIGFKYDFK